MNMASYTLNNKLDFLRHNNRSVKRDKKIKEIKIKGRHIFLIVFFFSVIATGMFFFGKFIMTWEKLNINTYMLENSEKIDQNSIRKILSKYSGNILGVDLGKMKKDFMEINKIKEVIITRVLPSGINILFITRKPVLQFKFNGRWSVVDNEGIIIDKGSGKNEKLLLVKGVSKEHIKEIIPYLQELRSIKKQIEYVSIKKPFGILLKLKGKNIRVFPGVCDYKKKIGYYLKLKKRNILKHINVTSIDMRFENRIYLEYEKEQIGG